MTVDDYIDNGRRMLTRFYERYQPFNQGTLIGAEMSIPFHLPGTPFNFVAKIDRLWRNSDGAIEIADYKTGRIPPLGLQDANLRGQMGLYQLAVQTAFPDFRDVEIALYFLKHDERLSCRFQPEELDELTEQLRCEVLAVREAERLDEFPTREGALCNYCDYRTLCPAKRHRLILDGETGAQGKEKATAETAAELADKYIEANRRLRELTVECDALKADLQQAAKDLGLEKFAGALGAVSVKEKVEDKFITKSEAAGKVGDLNFLVRQWGFDAYFSLATGQFMKDGVRKGRLSDEQLAQLQDFIIRKPTVSVRVSRAKSESADEA
jgi:putative RecB family exonuclease